jgi:hypothetical protein
MIKLYRKQTTFEPQTDSTQQQQKVNITYLVQQEIAKICASAWKGDESGYSNAVENLFKLLPIENKKHIEDNKEKYIATIEQPTWKLCSGKQMGSLENPVFANVKGKDWNWSADVNNGKPIRISPIVNEVEETNYQNLFGLIIEEMQGMGILWKTEPHDRVGKRIKQPPTPLLTLKDGRQVRILLQKDVPPEIELLQNEDNSTETDNDNSDEDDNDIEEVDIEEDEQ